MTDTSPGDMRRGEQKPTSAARRWRQRAGPWAVSVGLALCLSALAGTATAKPAAASIARAEALSRQAISKFRARSFDAAAKLFLRAYQLARKPTSVFNAARAKESAGHDAEAKALYELYLRLGESADGVVDARQRIAAIDGREAAKRAAVAKRMAAASAAAERERLRAAEATRRAEEARSARKVAQKQLGALRAAAAARRKRAAANPRYGLIILPGTSSLHAAHHTASSALLERMAVLLAGEAASASIGGVRGHATLRGPLARRPGGAASCPLACRLALARKLGAAFAAGVSLYGKRGALHARVVLWRTIDGAEAGEVEITGANPNALLAASMVALGDVFNGVRRYAVQPARAVTAVAATGPTDQAPAGRVSLQISADPAGAQVFIDEKPIGPAPLRVHVAIGAHRVRLVAPHHRRRGGRLVASVGGGRVHIVLPADDTTGAGTAVAPGATAVTAATNRQTEPVTTHHPPDGPPPARPTTRREVPADRRTSGEADGSGEVKTPSRASARGADSVGHARAMTTERRAAPDAEPPGSIPWGVVLSAGALLSTHDSGGVYVDAAPGAYAMVHVGLPRGRALPWIYLALGGGAEFYQGMPSSVGGPRVYSGFLGVGFPRVAGLLFGVRHHWVRENSSVGKFTFTSAEVRIIAAQRHLFFAIGGRALLRSTRHGIDDFGQGPSVSLFVELGWSIGGRGLSR